MATEVIMPKLGLTMTEGTIQRWLKSDGDPVEKGEFIMEILTDKASMEVEAPASGILRILRPEGEVVPITEVIGYVLEPGEELPGVGGAIRAEGVGEEGVPVAAEPEVAGVRGETATPGSLAPAPPSEEIQVKASPAARRVARELGLSPEDMKKIKGTGPEGRIVEEDVRRAAETLKAEVLKGQAGQEAEEVIILSGVRKVIADRMSRSTREAPQFHVTVEVVMDQVAKLREELLPKVEAAYGVRLSYTEILVKVVARALQEFKLLNSFVSDTEVRVQKEINMGIATNSEGGLVVPVVRNADRKRVGELSREIKDMVRKAREGRLALEDISGGTFTLSNMGMFGVDSFAAILNPPQAGILAVGAMKDRVFVKERAFVAHKVASFTITCDHRAVDGVLAANFLARVKQILEGEELHTVCEV